MQQNNYNKNYTKPQLENILLKDTIRVSMPDDFLRKVKYICQQIPKVEWSGILFYTMKGTIRNPKSVKIVLKDILPMHKGSSAFTEYDYDEAHIEYVMKDEKRMDWKMGHIHSHNTMRVFFSGTDMDELADNSASHNFYLSLIVNNFMDFCAKIGIRGEVETTITSIPYVAMDENGDKYNIQSNDFTLKKQKLFIYDCDIAVRNQAIRVDNEFANGVKRIIDISNKPPAQQKPQTPKNNNVKQLPASTVHNRKYPTNYPVKQKPTEVVKKFVDDIPYGELADMNFTFDTFLTDTELFTIALIHGTNIPDGIESVEDALDVLAAMKPEPIELSKGVIAYYLPLYEKYFEQHVYDEDFFKLTAEEVIEILEDNEIHYSFLSNLIMTLKFMLIKYEENVTTTI